jgi:hypothetical protein
MIDPLIARCVGRASVYLYRHQPPRVLAEVLVKTAPDRLALFLALVAEVQMYRPGLVAAVGDCRFAPPILEVVPPDVYHMPRELEMEDEP